MTNLFKKLPYLEDLGIKIVDSSFCTIPFKRMSKQELISIIGWYHFRIKEKEENHDQEIVNLLAERLR